VTGFWLGNVRERHHSDDLGVVGMIKLPMDLQKV
jgi:hypothetical protein